MIDICKLYNNLSLKANYENISMHLNENSFGKLYKNNTINNIYLI